jgi:hypothetical protein
LERCNSAVFWQTERYLGIFFTYPETDDFTGFSGHEYAKRSPNWAYFPLGPIPLYSQVHQNQGPAAHVRTGRVHQREVGVNVSLSVSHEYEQQRRTFREAVCEERAGAAAGAGATRQARGVILPAGHNVKQRSDVKRAGVQ